MVALCEINIVVELSFTSTSGSLNLCTKIIYQLHWLDQSTNQHYWLDVRPIFIKSALETVAY